MLRVASFGQEASSAGAVAVTAVRRSVLTVMRRVRVFRSRHHSTCHATATHCKNTRNNWTIPLGLWDLSGPNRPITYSNRNSCAKPCKVWTWRNKFIATTCSSCYVASTTRALKQGYLREMDRKWRIGDVSPLVALVAGTVVLAWRIRSKAR